MVKYVYSIRRAASSGRWGVAYIAEPGATSSPPREKHFFFQHLSREKSTPGHENRATWASFGVWITTRCRARKKTFLRRCSKKELAENRKKIIWRSRPASQSIRRGQISREGALDVRASRERRDKIVPKFYPEKQEKRNFGLIFSFFLSRIACPSRESTSAWLNCRKKEPKKKKK